MMIMTLLAMLYIENIGKVGIGTLLLKAIIISRKIGSIFKNILLSVQKGNYAVKML